LYNYFHDIRTINRVGDVLPKPIFDQIAEKKKEAQVDHELFLNKEAMDEVENENREHAKFIYSKPTSKYEKAPDAIDKIKLGGNAIKRLIASDLKK
jgi:hypothetical protein